MLKQTINSHGAGLYRVQPRNWPTTITIIERKHSMKTKLSLLALAAMLSGQVCLAQTNEPADDWKPATANQQGKQYPQVNSEGYVRARIVAPQAQSVSLDLGGVKYGSREVTGGRGMGANGKANAEALKEAGINSHYYESPLTAHEWQSWRRSLYQFAPLLFQN
jgi:hypothetical protein